MITPRFLSCDPQNGAVSCELCHHKCEIKNGNFGVCGVRGNKSGTGIIPFYGFVTAMAMDPIEKKPLYHFKPGSQILSLGFAGCNLKCPFCQNWHISQNTDIQDEDRRGKPRGKFMKPADVIFAALANGSSSIAYTYSEPLIHIEFLLDCMSIARKHGIANVLVTNGGINSGAANEVLALTDAANIDLKSFSADTYKNILKGDLQTVLDFIKLAYKMGVHIEVTTLIVTDLNDTMEEIKAIAEFIASIENAREGERSQERPIPWHLTAYHPAYCWDAPPTDPAFLRRAAAEARKILTCVHTGNI